jgi:tryptophanyl-tRNA synthetase
MDIQITNNIADCSHKHIQIKVLEVTVTCETTVLICSECKEYLAEPITEC